MNAFGLTGNMGCGKSTVASLLSQYPDVVTIDCDSIAKKLIDSGKHNKEIRRIFGGSVFLGIAGDQVFRLRTPDHSMLANEIFFNPQKQEAFENLLHPLVWETVQERVSSAGDTKLCIVESAIIYETGSEGKFAAMIVATCNRTEQFKRLRKNRGMNNPQIQARLDRQLPSEEKEAKAQFVIRTDCEMEELKDRVANLYRNLKQLKGTLP